jgi:hypothetical protein
LCSSWLQWQHWWWIFLQVTHEHCDDGVPTQSVAVDLDWCWNWKRHFNGFDLIYIKCHLRGSLPCCRAWIVVDIIRTAQVIHSAFPSTYTYKLNESSCCMWLLLLLFYLPLW